MKIEGQDVVRYTDADGVMRLAPLGIAGVVKMKSWAARAKRNLRRRSENE